MNFHNFLNMFFQDEKIKFHIMRHAMNINEKKMEKSIIIHPIDSIYVEDIFEYIQSLAVSFEEPPTEFKYE